VDGLAEIRLSSMAAGLITTLHAREVYLDEQNAFARVLGQLTGPGGGRWWTTGHDDGVTHRTAVLMRRRRGVAGRTFRRFVRDALAPALHAAGARDLRAYTFTPFTKLTHSTPGVCHDNPAYRRYHAALVIGANSRDHINDLLASAEASAVIAEQAHVITAAHAYTIERTVAVVQLGST
jgi:hypothetical protein